MADSRSITVRLLSNPLNKTQQKAWDQIIADVCSLLFWYWEWIECTKQFLGDWFESLTWFTTINISVHVGCEPQCVFLLYRIPALHREQFHWLFQFQCHRVLGCATIIIDVSQACRHREETVWERQSGEGSLNDRMYWFIEGCKIRSREPILDLLLSIERVQWAQTSYIYH